MSFEPIHSEPIYQGRVFNVRRDLVRLPNGKTSQLDVLEHAAAVMILPIDADGQVWFVRQYRYAAGQELLELPAGGVEPGELPLACAQRETQEEIGMQAGQLQLIGEFYLAPGYSTEYMYLYLATQLSPAPLPGDDDEFLSVERIPVAQVLAMAASGQMRDAKTLAALFLAQSHLSSSLPKSEPAMV